MKKTICTQPRHSMGVYCAAAGIKRQSLVEYVAVSHIELTPTGNMGDSVVMGGKLILRGVERARNGMCYSRMSAVIHAY